MDTYLTKSYPSSLKNLVHGVVIRLNMICNFSNCLGREWVALFCVFVERRVGIKDAEVLKTSGCTRNFQTASGWAALFACFMEERVGHFCIFVFERVGIRDAEVFYTALKRESRKNLYFSGKTCCGYLFVATDKVLFFIRKMLISFLFLHENICCGYSLEAPRNKKHVDTPSYLWLCLFILEAPCRSVHNMFCEEMRIILSNISNCYIH